MIDNSQKMAYKVSLNTIVLNTILSVLKLIAGIIGNSSAMISDAVHSGSDVLSTVVVMIGIKISSKKADEKHPYGHEKLESIASMILGSMLFVTAILIGYYGILKILKFSHGEVVFPGVIALIAAIISIIVKEWMYHYTKNVADKINSTSLYADAWHHRSDAFSSIGSLLGILGAMMGLPILDPIFSIIICVVIVKVAYDILRTAIAQIIDTKASDEVEDNIREIINSFDEVEVIDLLRTRQFGNKIYVDIEVRINKDSSFEEVHDIIHRLHDKIELSNESIKHCMIHANPTA